jgi:hypothetical protein
MPQRDPVGGNKLRMLVDKYVALHDEVVSLGHEGISLDEEPVLVA